MPILDAIAALSVFEERGQVVAVALQMDRDAKTIRLTVSENRCGRVEPRVLAQIDAIWTILQSLSTEYCRLRSLSRRMEDPHEWGDQCSEPPITPQLSAARKELVRLVYTFCWKKFNIRVEKWWPYLDSLSMKITSFLYIEGGVDPSGLMNKFLGAVVMLRMALPIVKNLPDQSFPISLWNVFSQRMDTTIEKAVDILSDDMQCEAWGKRFRGEIHRSYFPSSCTFDSDLRPAGEYYIPVRRALEKLTSLHRYIEVLVRFANSRRLRPALSYRLSIIPVTPPPRRQIALPGSVDEWETTVDFVCAGKDFTTANWGRKQAVELADHFSSSYLCATHCECSLIAHLEAIHTPGTTPAFSYIGVSKLSCRACMLWITAFNRRGGRQYFTRGTHGKWYWPWAAPVPDLLPSEAAVVAEAVRAECVRFIKASGHFRAGSGSSDASADKVARSAPEVAKKMDMEIEGGIESMLRILKSEQPK